MTRPVSRPSLRTELRYIVALVATTALFIALGIVALLPHRALSAREILLVALLLAAAATLVAALGAYRLHLRILRPLRAAAECADAIATGDLRQRIASQQSQELGQLADSVNRMADRLRDEQTQLVRAERLASVGRLAADVAQEIGAPLDALNSYSRILRAHVATNPRALRTAAALDRESSHIERVVRGLLDYARPCHSEPTLVDVNESVRHVADLLSAQGVLRRVTLRLELANESPRVRGARQDLEQLLVNLLLNAAHAVDGTGIVAIRTACMSRYAIEDGRVRAGDKFGTIAPRSPSAGVLRWLESDQAPEEVMKIVVADSGPGVPLEDRERVFDPFFSTRAPSEGAGLGLAIVLRIVESLEGIVWVESSREGGAAFHVMLPLAASFLCAAPIGMTADAPFPALF
jgi:hypothetical protein